MRYTMFQNNERHENIVTALVRSCVFAPYSHSLDLLLSVRLANCVLHAVIQTPSALADTTLTLPVLHNTACSAIFFQILLHHPTLHPSKRVFWHSVMVRDISVGIGTRYELEVPRIESRWGGEIFRETIDRPWGPHSPVRVVNTHPL